jgi:hypothetical protein
MPGGAKHFIFVVNNYESLLDPSLWPLCSYCVYQEEIGASGTPHLQGFVSFSAKRTLRTVTSLPGLDHAHVEVAKGSPASNEAYCTKEEGRLGGPYRFGELPSGQGARKDLDIISDKIKAGRSLKRIAEDHPSDFIRYHRGFQALQTAVAPRRSNRMKTVCLVFYGPGGTGKSSFARLLAQRLSSDDGASGDVFSLAPSKASGQYWEGYNQGDVVIIDEMDGSRMKPTEFNQLIDSGEHCVPVHGNQVQFNSRYVLITTNVNPFEWWPNLKARHSLQRRICIWHLFRRLDLPPRAPRPSVVYEPRLGQYIHSRK